MAGILRSLWKLIRNSDSLQQAETRLEETARQAQEERRAAQRFAGPVHATISAGLSSFPESVILRDLNEKGVYVYSSAAFPRGATLEIVTELPAELSLYGKRRVHYTASVVRCEENAEEGKYGIAAVIKKCEVLPPRASDAPAPSAAILEPESRRDAEKESPKTGAAADPSRAADSARVGD